MKGITTIFDHKKWVFAYLASITITTLISKSLIDGSQFTLLAAAIIAATIGASSFDKSKWAKDD